MLNQSISLKAVKLLGRNTWRKFTPQTDYNKFVVEVLDRIEKKFIDDEYVFSVFSSKTLNGKKGYDFSNDADELISKKLNDNIRRLFKVKPSDRHAIVKQTISLAKDTQPVTIARLDIKDFYESIDRDAIINLVSEEWLLSQQNRQVLKCWNERLILQGVIGLPRGMALSSTLSEIKIRDFDRAMKLEDNVYFYARYVDDIIIFFSGDESELKRALCTNLKRTASELDFNAEKSKFYSLNSAAVSEFIDIDYLGYRINIEANPKDIMKMRLVNVFISDKKINKIKNRIRRAFCAYSRDRNFQLLSHRLKFLSGNQYIIGDIDRTKLKSGIYYNYPLLTSFIQLDELDAFYKKILTCPVHPISSAIRMIKNHGGGLSDVREKQIHSISFKFGFHKRIMNNFSAKVSKKIKRCW